MVFPLLVINNINNKYIFYKNFIKKKWFHILIINDCFIDVFCLFSVKCMMFKFKLIEIQIIKTFKILVAQISEPLKWKTVATISLPIRKLKCFIL
jgi:hypothetical protein